MKNTLIQSELTRHRTPGFTMVEIMVAMVIGLILMAGTIQVFIGNKQTYRTTEASSRLQENARFAMAKLTQDIRMAGFTGCATDSNDLTNTLKCDGHPGVVRDADGICPGEDDFVSEFNVGIDGLDNVGANISLDSANDVTTIAGTDVVVIRRNSGDGVNVIHNNNGAQVNLEITTTEVGACPDGSNRISGLCQGDILMVSDCSKSRVFELTNMTVSGGTGNAVHSASGTPGNSPSSWGGASPPASERFGSDASIVKVVSYAYYIALNAYGSPALYRKEGAANGLEMVENVENMQVLYGEDTSGDGVANYYAVASSVADMSAVVSVRITLNVISDNNISMTNQTHSISGATDRRLRQAFTTTIGIRNRLN